MNFPYFRVTIEHARVRLRGGRGRRPGGGRFSDRYGRGSQSSRRYTKKENFLKSISNYCHEMLSVISSRINIESSLYVILHFLVFFSRNPPPVRTENRLIVENLSSRVSWQVIIALYFLYIYT